MQVQYVIKRDGRKQEKDISKIKGRIALAVEGLNVNPLELEASISEDIVNDMKTSDIDELLMLNSMKLVSVDSPHWVIVAGRLEMHNMNRNISKNIGFAYYPEDNKGFADFVKYMVEIGQYKEILLSYTDKELEKLASAVNPSYDNLYTIGGVMSLKKKYLHKKSQKVIELPQFADMVSSMIIHANDDKAVRLTEVITDYKLIGAMDISLATPLKANIRKIGGSTSSCFLVEFDDNIESIMKVYKDMAYISKKGGGIGAYLSKIRPESSLLQSHPVANNISLWTKIINDIAIAVNQAGVRAGAITPGLDVWHKDIYSFLGMKHEVGGDLRLKSFDLFPQVIVNNVFMDRVHNDDQFWLVDNAEIINLLGDEYDLTEMDGVTFAVKYPEIEAIYESGKLTNGEQVSAKELWKEILGTYVEIGDLYIANRDNMNAHNPVAINNMLIKLGNLCMESFSPIKASKQNRVYRDEEGTIYDVWDKPGYYHTCDLISINLANHVGYGWEKKLEHSTRRAVRILDTTMDITTVPIIEGIIHNDLFRTIGIGTLGVADWMAWNKLSYNKPADYVELEKVYEMMAYWIFDESSNIGKEKGNFAEFENSSFPQGIILGKTGKQLNKDSVAGLDWVALIEKTSKFMRNMLTFSIAPNTSTSALMGVSASYLPVFSKFFYESMSNLSVPIVPKYIDKRYWYYNESTQVPTENIIKLTGMLQKWVDTGISMELVINPSITNIKKISDALIAFFKNGGKTVYYSRTLDMEGNLGDKKVGCTDCAN